MKLQRCQHNKVESCFDFNIVTGQNGRGIYCFKYGNKAMKAYYSQNGEKCYSFEIENRYIKDLSKSKMDYWEIQAFIYNNPQYKAFIFKHKGHKIPTSKEVLITDHSIISLLTNFQK